MEDLISEEVSRLGDQIAASNGEPVSLHLTLNVSVINALWKILTGEPFHDAEDPKLKRLVALVDDMLSANSAVTVPAMLLPYEVMTHRWVKPWTDWARRKATSDALLGLVMPYVGEHHRTFDAGHIRDFMDAYLLQVRINHLPYYRPVQSDPETMDA